MKEGSLFLPEGDFAEDETWEWQGLPKMLLVHQGAGGGFFFGFVREGVCPAGGIQVGEADLQTLLNGPSEGAEDLSVGSWGADSGLNVQLALQGGLEQKWRMLAAAGGWEEVEVAPDIRLQRF